MIKQSGFGKNSLNFKKNRIHKFKIYVYTYAYMLYIIILIRFADSNLAKKVSFNML